MGIWNFYFIAKLFLYFGHYINFHLLPNLAFALLLVIPLQRPRLKLLRQLAAIPLGIALLYHDSWLPPLAQVMSKSSQLEGFSAGYLFELLGRFISPPVVAALLLIYVVYFFAKKKLRITTFVFLAMLAPPLLLALKPSGVVVTPETTANSPPAATAGTAATSGPPTDANLTAQLDAFYKQEATRSVSFAPPAKSDAPFDIIFIQICSLSWDDMDFVKQRDNALFKRFNIVFSNFSSAASYSGPAAIRLLRGSCGQQRHKSLYDPAPAQCDTFDDLQQVGYTPQLAMNHDGHFGDFISDVRDRGGMHAPLMDDQGLPAYLQSFDGSPVYDDYSVLSRWWQQRLATPDQRVALFYNTISLHDGNRYAGKRTSNSLEIYPPRLARLLDDLDHFFDLLSKSGRRAVVVFIPEHGASIRGDKMQIAGMREIPSPRISIVPVGIKLIGMPENPATKPLLVSEPTSYLAVSKLLANFIRQSPFDAASPNLQEYARDLPATEFEAENEDVVVMRRGNQYFMRSKDAGWVEYEPD